MNTLTKIGEVNFGQYRVTFVHEKVNGEIVVHKYAEVYIPECATRDGKSRHAHWRLVTGKLRERVLAAARHPELRKDLPGVKS